jgi:hypothetical protein
MLIVLILIMKKPRLDGFRLILFPIKSLFSFLLFLSSNTSILLYSFLFFRT